MKRLACLLVVLTFSLTAALPVRAYNPHDYYDWSTVAYPQVLGETEPQDTAPTGFNRYLLAAGTLPGQPLYFFKRLQENVQLAFTFNPAVKTEKELAVAGERLNEIDRLVSAGETDQLGAALNNYSKLMDSVSRKLPQLKQAAALAGLEKETAKHNLALEQTLLAVPEAGQQAVRESLRTNYQVSDTLADNLNQPPLTEEIMARLLDLKAQGLLTQPDIDRITGYDSRRKTREVLNKLTEAGIFPEADLVKLNQAVADYFPDEFNQTIEGRKFLELEKLEADKPSEETIKQIQSFAKTYEVGETVPAYLKKDWNKVVRLEELQNTIQPQMVDFNQWQNQEERKNRFIGLVGQLQPRQEDINKIHQLKQSGRDLPLELKRLESLSQYFGTNKAKPPVGETCPSNSHWNPAGYCVPNITYTEAAITATPGQYPSPVYAPGAPDPTKYHNPNPNAACPPPESGCPADQSWDHGRCQCVVSASASSTPVEPSVNQNQPVDNPPGGQGSCPEGSTWNGSTCHFPPAAPNP